MNGEDNISHLSKRIANDDQSAYRLLYIHFYSRLFRFVMGLAKNKELSEEIVSDVFINIWRRRSRIEEITNLKLYLYVSAKNITFNYLKKLNQENTTDLNSIEIEPEDPFSNPDDAMITKEMNMQLKEAIKELPPKCKLIFTLIKEDGLTYKQTARLLNLSVSTIDNQLSIALKKIAGTIQYALKK